MLENRRFASGARPQKRLRRSVREFVRAISCNRPGARLRLPQRWRETADASSSLLRGGSPLRFKIADKRLVVQAVHIDRDARHVGREMRKLREMFLVEEAQAGRQSRFARKRGGEARM